MNIKIIFDNNSQQNFEQGWGLSFLIDGHILFDIGEKAESLFNNMERLNIDIEAIDTVVISHDHWDHTGGLEEILKRRSGIEVYACPSFSQEFKAKVKAGKGKLIEVSTLKALTDTIFTTGEIEGLYKAKYIGEQSLVIRVDYGLVLLTGCAHPGIIKVLEVVKDFFKKENVVAVFGGFHLKDKDEEETLRVISKLKEMGVKRIGPMHCTGDKALAWFEESYKENYISLKSGSLFNL